MKHCNASVDRPTQWVFEGGVILQYKRGGDQSLPIGTFCRILKNEYITNPITYTLPYLLGSIQIVRTGKNRVFWPPNQLKKSWF